MTIKHRNSVKRADNNTETPAEGSGEEEDADAAAADADDGGTDVQPRTCLNGMPAEYCAAVVQILCYIGLFIAGFINLR